MDSHLIIKAQFRAGAKVHDVNALSHAYKLWDRLAADGDPIAGYVVADLERALRRFVATGAIDRTALQTPARMLV
jgi:hypothetical protein